MRRQRGHTLSKTRHCGEMGGFSGRRGAPHRGTGKLDVEGLGAPKQGTTLCKVQQKGRCGRAEDRPRNLHGYPESLISVRLEDDEALEALGPDFTQAVSRGLEGPWQ